ncbi:sugar transferase [Glaciihabitans arcticus]|uniref:Sugar transferase n=1 Tax=Glaciihabitans arcticus TaxID=2668039 RepID=A0A4Q9GUU1_9MICO|nr:sugar transferase [Glaciihabitans arcticus]TBN57984.1 sugar transferase [Glaciihabitans arcticus]
MVDPSVSSVSPDALSTARRALAALSAGLQSLPPLRLDWARVYALRLLLADSLITFSAVVFAHFAQFTFEPPGRLTGITLEEALVVLVWGASLAVFRTRSRTVLGIGTAEYKSVIQSTLTAFGVLAMVFLVAQSETTRWLFLVALPLGTVGLLANRWNWRRWLNLERASGQYLSRVVVAGNARDVAKVVRQVGNSVRAGYRVVGVVVDEQEDGRAARDYAGSDITVSTYLDGTADFVRGIGCDGVIVAGQPSSDSEFIHDLAWRLEGSAVELIIATSLANVAGPRIHFRPVDGLPLLHVEIPQFTGGKHLLKRAMDIVLAGGALLALAPLFAVIAALIRLDRPGPAVFSQERVGLNGSTFRIFKFRSMVVDAPQLLAQLAAANEGSGVLFKMKHDPRVTRVGRLLRKYSLDELPQLWNILIGDMSIVGPRPPLPSEVEGYETHVHRRLYIKPGLTGMWQVNGRSNLSWEESVRLDLYYVENWSVVGDLAIMWRTIKVVIDPVGAY